MTNEMQFRQGQKVLLVGDSYRPRIIYKVKMHKHGGIRYQVRSAYERVRINYTASELMPYVPYWKWWLYQKLNLVC